MEIIQKPINEIYEYENNPVSHPETQIDKIAESISKYGFLNPIIIDQVGVIIAGHGRFNASKKLGLEKVPCVVATDLTDNQIKEFRIADNRLSEMSDWDGEKLSEELLSLNKEFSDMLEMKFDLNLDKKETQKDTRFKDMDLKPDEHHDYLVFLFDNQSDWIFALNQLGVERVHFSEYSKKIGIGRVLKGEKLIEIIEKQNENK